jgi:ribosomal protein S18 acetylase RimI-like enzyme
MSFMESLEHVIRPIASNAADAFFAYLEDHLKDNGRNGAPMFQPQSRRTTFVAPEKVATFRAGLDTNVGAPNWRRAWAAFDSSGAIAGHVDLRARPEPCSSHRALLGMGVHRKYRGRRLGGALVQHAIAWAIENTGVDWIDLTFLGGNLPAERLYRSAGFQRIATVPDMFRIDGESISDVQMTRRIRP